MTTPPGNDPYGQQPPPPPPPNPYGTPDAGGSGYGSPGYGAYDAPGSAEPPKTDGVSIASLVLSLLCCTSVIGFILGFVGLKRTKGGQRKGRGLAIAGIVLGALGTLAFAGLVIAIIAGGVFLASVVDPEDAKAGQCVNIDDDDSGVLLREAECNEEHDGEIIAVTELTDDNVEQATEAMTAYCAEIIDPEDLEKLSEYAADIKAVTEDPDNPEPGDYLICYVDPGEKLDESIL